MKGDTTFDVLILGGGASGLTCALHAARRGVRVAVVDHGSKLARKVRVAGGGKCNFTNLGVEPEHYLCANPHFVKSALARHTQWDVISFFAERGISYEEREHGQLFTLEGAGRLAGVLIDECVRHGVTMLAGRTITGVDGPGPYVVETGGERLTAEKVVIALGGPSWSQVGATDLAFRLAAQFGLAMVEPRPGLVPLVFPRKRQAMCRDLAGNALPVTVSLGPVSFTDPLLFTHTGISGPAVLQISSYWRKRDTLTIDFLPGRSVADDLEEGRTANTQLKTALGRLLPKRLVPHLVDPALAATPLSQLRREQAQIVEERVHRFRVTPASTAGYDKAEVTVGGIDTDAISSKTFGAHAVPGLYVIGEALDVTGHLGGYNLQWAFASGAACGGSV